MTRTIAILKQWSSSVTHKIKTYMLIYVLNTDIRNTVLTFTMEMIFNVNRKKMNFYKH